LPIPAIVVRGEALLLAKKGKSLSEKGQGYLINRKKKSPINSGRILAFWNRQVEARGCARF
jgi:hypothetical protein